MDKLHKSLASSPVSPLEKQTHKQIEVPTTISAQLCTAPQQSISWHEWGCVRFAWNSSCILFFGEEACQWEGTRLYFRRHICGLTQAFQSKLCLYLDSWICTWCRTTLYRVNHHHHYLHRHCQRSKFYQNLTSVTSSHHCDSPHFPLQKQNSTILPQLMIPPNSQNLNSRPTIDTAKKLTPFFLLPATNQELIALLSPADDWSLQTHRKSQFTSPSPNTHTWVSAPSSNYFATPLNN